LPEPAAALTPAAEEVTEPTATPVPVPDPAPALSAERGADRERTLLPRTDPAHSTLTPELRREVERIARLQDETRSTLTPELRREADRIARLQDEALQRDPAQGPQRMPPGREPIGELDIPTTRPELTRAPSPTEARPLRAIPVPEEFIPLAPRHWSPNRKYWAAAATCHSPLYFQDAALERYGYSVEQHFGTAGRCLTYPIDDPTQSKQRNQILQPFFSAGLMAAQIIALPYNLLVDPPWEAEYDLGYYRPGDRVPADVYYLPWHGVGPPLRGMNY
jgi:hypothetical protein